MKLVELLAIPIGFALVRSITKNIKDEPAPKKIVPTGFTLGPAAASMDIAPLIPEGAFKITPTQLTAFTPDRKVTIPKYDPGVPVAQPITQGKIKKFGTGVSLADLLARQTPRK